MLRGKQSASAKDALSAIARLPIAGLNLQVGIYKSTTCREEIKTTRLFFARTVNKSIVDKEGLRALMFRLTSKLRKASVKVFRTEAEIVLTDKSTNHSQKNVIAKPIENEIQKLFRKEVPICNHEIEIEKEEGAKITQQKGKKLR